MSRHRRYTDSALVEAVQSSRSIRQVLAKLGLSPTGVNYLGIQRHFRQLQLDTSHFRGQGWLKGQKHSWTPKRPLSEILIVNSPVRSTSALKRRLIRESILDNRCYECDSPPV